MKKYIIDTNALISFVTDRNQAQQEIVAPPFAANIPGFQLVGQVSPSRKDNKSFNPDTRKGSHNKLTDPRHGHTQIASRSG